jgi:CheY-like chemotaxis protein
MSSYMASEATTWILIIDDCADDALDLKARYQGKWEALFGEKLGVLCCTGVEIGEHRSSTDTVTLSDVGKYDAILLDIMWGSVPKGIETAEAIRRRYPLIPIIVISNKAKRQHFTKLLAYRINGYLDKTEPGNPACEYIRTAIQQQQGDELGWDLVNKVKLTAIRDGGWHGETVWGALRAFTRGTNSYERWLGFRDAWHPVLEPLGATTLLADLTNLFHQHELLTLISSASMRGHLEHVVHVYMLGYLISHNAKCVRSRAEAVVRDLLPYDAKTGLSDVDLWDYYQWAWLFAALLHDVGYALEVVPDIVPGLDCAVSEFPGAVMEPAALKEFQAQGWDPTNPHVRAADVAIKGVLGRLRRSDLADLVSDEKSRVFKKGRRKFNHGFASAVRFIKPAEEALRNLRGRPSLVPAVQWAGTAMALHAMREPMLASTERHAKAISLNDDPLSFLLAVCDEIQEWNRARPDQKPEEGGSVVARYLRATRLVHVAVESDTVTAKVEYVPYDHVGDAELGRLRAALVTQREEKDLKLRAFLNGTPLRLHVEFSLLGCGTIGKPLEIT